MTEMFLVHICCLHLSSPDVRSCACSHRYHLLRDIAAGQSICSAGGILNPSLPPTNNPRAWLPYGHFVMMTHGHASIFVWMDLVYIRLLFGSVLNYPKSNCYQIKSQRCYYPGIQSWQPDQSSMVTMIAA